MVGASGNDNSANPEYPAFWDNVLAVTAVTRTDAKASFANFGKYVDVSSPGEFIISTFPHGYAQGSGTSQATAIASGVAALAKSSGVRDKKLIDTLEKAVDEVKDVAPYKNLLGAGRIDAAKAVKP